MPLKQIKQELLQALKQNKELHTELTKGLNHERNFRSSTSILAKGNLEEKESYRKVRTSADDSTTAINYALDDPDSLSTCAELQTINEDLEQINESWWYIDNFIDLCLKHKLDSNTELMEDVNLYKCTSSIDLNPDGSRKQLFDHLANPTKRFDIIPFNNTPEESVGGSHWTILFIDHKAKKVLYFDSKYASDLSIDSIKKKIKDNEVESGRLANLGGDDDIEKMSFLTEENDNLMPINRAHDAYKKLSLENYKFEFSKRAIQDNSHDCGVHVIEAISMAFDQIKENKEKETSINYIKSFFNYIFNITGLSKLFKSDILNLDQIADTISGSAIGYASKEKILEKKDEHLSVLKGFTKDLNKKIREVINENQINSSSSSTPLGKENTNCWVRLIKRFSREDNVNIASQIQR